MGSMLSVSEEEAAVLPPDKGFGEAMALLSTN